MATRTRTKKTDPVALTGPALTVDDLIGGESKTVRSTFIPELGRTVHYRSLSAGRVIDLMQIEIADDNQSRVISEMIDVLADVLCNKDGSTLVTREQLLSVPMDRVKALMQAVSGLGGGEAADAGKG